MEVSDAYRKGRRNTSIFCGISLAWSAAQFELKSLNLGGVGSIDISGASIPLILACAIIYTFVRCTLEFIMQPFEVRRWNLAHIDYKITLNLVRITLLVLAATGLSRSIETAALAIFAVPSFILVFFILVSLLMLVIMPTMMFINKLRGCDSVATSAFESTILSMFIVGIGIVVLQIYFGVSLFKHELFNSIWPVPPSPLAVIIFIATALIITFSFFYEGTALKKLFAFEPKTIVEKKELSDGTIGVTFKDNPNHPDYVAPPNQVEQEQQK